MTNKTIANIFREFADKIENNTCGVDPGELEIIANKMIHIKMNIEQTCRHLNCSRATLNRMIVDGRVPRPKKELGGKEYWYQDELDDYIEKHK